MEHKILNFLSSIVNRVFPNQEAMAFSFGFLIFFIVLYNFVDVLFPILLSIFIAFMLYEPVLWLEKKGVPRAIPALIALFLLFSLTVLFFGVFIPLLWEESLALIKLLPELNLNTQNYIEENLADIPFIEVDTVRDFITTLVSQVSSSVKQILSFSLSSIASVIVALLYCVLVPVLVFFFLYDGESIYAHISRLALSDSLLMKAIWQQTVINLMRYIRGKMIEMVIVSCASYLALAAFSVKYAFLLGLATGVAVLIPYVGATLVALLVLVTGLYHLGLDIKLLYALLAYSVVQALDAYLLVPWLFSSALNLRPVTVLIAITFFGGVWGVWGVLLAIPLATFIKVVVLAWPKINKTTNKKVEES